MTASWPVIASSTSSTFVGFDGVADARELVHQRLVDVQAAGGVDDDDVAARRPAPRSSPSRRRPATGSCVSLAVDRDLDLLAELLELVDRGRALEVGGDERRACLPSLRRSSASFADGGRLARALEAGEQDHRRRPAANASRESPAPISSVSSSWTIFTTCWPGVRLFSTSSPSARSLDAARRSP